MKSISIIFIFIFVQNSFGEQKLFSCTVPSENQIATAEISLGDDQSFDFITFSLVENSSKYIFFSQLEKGYIKKHLCTSQLDMLLLSENSKQDSGVIRSSGFLILKKEKDNLTYAGLFSGNGNLYPLLCKPINFFN